MRRDYENIVVLGASYVGLAAAKELSELADAAAAETKEPRYRVVLVEQHSHFGHSFVW
jgi:NADH dehydrogenase FAD-containing subunit